MENPKNIRRLLNERVNCPACNYRESNEIINLEWDHEILIKLFKLRNYPINFIKEGSYLLLECNKCSGPSIKKCTCS